MMTLRCTRNLLSRLGVILAPPETLPTTALGDWYAELLVARPNWLVLCISEKTLLSVVVAARPLATLVARFQAAVDARLLSLGVSQDQRENEMAEMRRIFLGPTMNRSVRGSLSELAFQARCVLEGNARMDLAELSAQLGKVPMTRASGHFPDRATLEILS